MAQYVAFGALLLLMLVLGAVVHVAAGRLKPRFERRGAAAQNRIVRFILSHMMLRDLVFVAVGLAVIFAWLAVLALGR